MIENNKEHEQENKNRKSVSMEGRMSEDRPRSKMDKLADQGMKKTAEEAVQLDKEVLHSNDLDQTLRLHHVAGKAREPVGIDPFGRKERRDRRNVAHGGGACNRRKLTVFLW
jgi:hypothetical protein